MIAFGATEPLPGARADLRAAMIALVTARAAGIKGVELKHFLLDAQAKSEPEEQDEAEMNRQMQKIAALMEAAEARKARA